MCVDILDAFFSPALVKGFEEQGVMGCTLSRLSDDMKMVPGCFFHILPYAESLLDSFGESIVLSVPSPTHLPVSMFLFPGDALFSGGSMWEVPEPCRVLLSSHGSPSSSDVEQVVVLTLSGTDMSQGLSVLERALRPNPTGSYLPHSNIFIKLDDGIRIL